MGYIVSVNVEGKRCVIAGGGKAALKKARTLSQEGAYITVVAPEISEELMDLGCRCVERECEPDDFYDAFLVYPMTDDEELNRRIAEYASDAGALVCGTDFTVPASRSGENITAAVSTGYPQLSAKLAESLLKYDENCRILCEFRERVKQTDAPRKVKKSTVKKKHPRYMSPPIPSGWKRLSINC